eukprot:506586_1
MPMLSQNIVNVICEGESVEKCCHLIRLSQLMNIYHTDVCGKSDSIFNIDNYQIYIALNDFHHLLQYHNDDINFEFIFNHFEDCNIEKCKIFQRNHRNRYQLRNKINERNELYPIDDNEYDGYHYILYCQILDKIHCFYKHCYDIGHKLTQKQKGYIKSKCDASMDDTITAELALKIKNVLLQKHSQYNNIRNENKFSKFDPSIIENKNPPLKQKRYESYNFGNWFIYTNATCHKWQSFPGFVGYVKPRHTSLKEELLENAICKIGFLQLGIEFNKAKIHFNSRHFKLLLIEHKCRYAPFVAIECLLSLLMYCNYNVLQYEFCATYRKTSNNETNKSLKNRHGNFYHMGNRIWDFILMCGDQPENTDRFYRGVSETFMFSSTSAFSFFTPLSTSTAFEVAVNFTSANKGIVIEVGKTHSWYSRHFAKLRGKTFSCPYISVSWLSDYGNESECIFIGGLGELSVRNIVFATSGNQYNSILSAFHCMDYMIDPTVQPVDNNRIVDYCIAIYCLDKCKMFEPRINELASEFIDCALAQQSQQRISFKGLHDYGNDLLNRYFKSIKKIKSSVLVVNMKYINYDKYKWNRLSTLLNLQSNITQIIFEMIEISISTMLDYILVYLTNNANIKTVQICIGKKSHKCKEIVQIYKPKLEDIDFAIMLYVGNAENNMLMIQNGGHFDLARLFNMKEYSNHPKLQIWYSSAGQLTREMFTYGR